LRIFSTMFINFYTYSLIESTNCKYPYPDVLLLHATDFSVFKVAFLNICKTIYYINPISGTLIYAFNNHYFYPNSSVHFSNNIYSLFDWIGVEGGDSEGISETGETSQRTRSGGEGSSLTPWRPTGCWSRRRCHTMWRS